MYFSKEIGNLKTLIHKIEAEPDRLLIFQQKSRNRIIENYTWEKIADQYDDLFRQMMNRC